MPCMVSQHAAAMQVALTLAEKVLTPPKQDVKVLDVAQVNHRLDLANISTCICVNWGSPALVCWHEHRLGTEEKRPWALQAIYHR